MVADVTSGQIDPGPTVAGGTRPTPGVIGPIGARKNVFEDPNGLPATGR